MLHIDCDYQIIVPRIEMVAVNPLKKAGGGLSLVLGQIVHDTADVLFSLDVLCVIAELTAMRQQKSKYPTQWPGRLEIDGQVIPE